MVKNILAFIGFCTVVGWSYDAYRTAVDAEAERKIRYWRYRT